MELPHPGGIQKGTAEPQSVYSEPLLFPRLPTKLPPQPHADRLAPSSQPAWGFPDEGVLPFPPSLPGPSRSTGCCAALFFWGIPTKPGLRWRLTHSVGSDHFLRRLPPPPALHTWSSIVLPELTLSRKAFESFLNL